MSNQNEQYYDLGMGGEELKAAIENEAGKKIKNGGEIFNQYSDVIVKNDSNIDTIYEANKADALYSHAEGFSTRASFKAAHAEGHLTEASGLASHAEGQQTDAIGSSSHAEGHLTQAREYASHAEGMCTIAIGEAQHVGGKYNKFEDNNESESKRLKNALVIIGNGTEEQRQNAYVLDRQGNAWFAGTVTAKEFITEAGASNKPPLRGPGSSSSSNTSTILVGEFTEDGGEIFGSYEDIEENGAERNQAIGYYTSAEGKSTRAGLYGYKLVSATPIEEEEGVEPNTKFIVVVEGTAAKSEYETGFLLSFDGKTHVYNALRVLESHMETGVTVFKVETADGKPDEKIVEDRNKDGSFNEDPWENWVYCLSKPDPLGGRPVLVAEGARAEGVESVATGRAAHAEGRLTNAYGSYGHAEGRETKAGYSAHAEGINTTASGSYSHAEGQITTAAGAESHAEGYSTFAGGKAAHAEGFDTKANGMYSHAEGEQSVVPDDTIKSAHVEGYRNIANYDYQHVSGKYNIPDDKAVVIGNGKYSSSGTILSEGFNSGSLNDIGGGWFDYKGWRIKKGQEKENAVGIYSIPSPSMRGLFFQLNNESEARSPVKWMIPGKKYTITARLYRAKEGSGGSMTLVPLNKYGEPIEGSGVSYDIAKAGIGTITEVNLTYTAKEGENQFYILFQRNGIANNDDFAIDEIAITSDENAIRSNAHTLDWDGNAWYAGSVEATALILKSESGKRFKITVNDNGELSTVEI